MAGKTGVYPCYKNQFQVGDAKEGATSIADMETFSVKFDNGVEEWYPFDRKDGRAGWQQRRASPFLYPGKEISGIPEMTMYLIRLLRMGGTQKVISAGHSRMGRLSPGMLQFITSRIRGQVNPLRLAHLNLM